MYLTATIGGVTRGRQFDLFVDDHYLLAGEFHVQNDCMIVVPENDRPQASDPAFLRNGMKSYSIVMTMVRKF